MFLLQCRKPVLLTDVAMNACPAALLERIFEIDQQPGLPAVAAVVVYLDYALRGAVFQRPILAVHRSDEAAGAWTSEHPYLDHLVSQHDVRRRVGPPYGWLPS